MQTHASPTAAGLTVTEVNDVAGLESYRLIWTKLFAQTRGASFFQTLDWLLVYLKHFGAGQRLRVLIVYQSGVPIGILPLVFREKRRGPVTLRALAYPLDDWGTFYGPIGANPSTTLRAALAHIDSTPRDWDYIDLQWIAFEMTDFGRTRAALALAGLEPEQAAGDQVALLDFEGDWHEFVAARGHKWRVNLRRSERKLSELGEVTFVRHRPAPATSGDGDPRWDLYDACEQVARESWQAGAHDGTTLSHESVRAFLRDAHEVAARLGMVDMNVLFVDGRPVAFIYNYVVAGELFGLRRGHVKDANAGAGTVLMSRVVADSFNRGDYVFNLGAGYLAAKQAWLTRIVRSQSLAVYPLASLKAQAVRVARGLKARLNRAG